MGHSINIQQTETDLENDKYALNTYLIEYYFNNR